MTKTSDALCDNCPFSKSIKDPSNIGKHTLECHLNPPTVVVVPVARGAAIHTQFPRVNETDYCYQHPNRWTKPTNLEGD